MRKCSIHSLSTSDIACDELHHSFKNKVQNYCEKEVGILKLEEYVFW